jgi:hypothetical protein
MKKLIFAAAAGLLCAAPALAQDAPAAPAPAPYRTLVTANPIGLLADYYNVEVERALSTVTSVSLAFERSTADDDNVTAGDVRFRYYPQARVFSGIALGASIGYGKFNEDLDDGEFEPGDDDDSMEGPTIGLEVDYSWLLGRDRRLYVGLGLGARRLLSGGDDDGDPTLVPGGRYFAIGYTF